MKIKSDSQNAPELFPGLGRTNCPLDGAYASQRALYMKPKIPGWTTIKKNFTQEALSKLLRRDITVILLILDTKNTETASPLASTFGNSRTRV